MRHVWIQNICLLKDVVQNQNHLSVDAVMILMCVIDNSSSFR